MSTGFNQETQSNANNIRVKVSSHVDPLLGVAFFIIIYNFRLRNNADLKS